MSNNRINKVAIVGATGHIGSHIAAALLQTGRHSLTAISRQGSSATFPSGITVAAVDYSDESTVIAALRGHDFLIISLASSVGSDVHATICNAAGKAGVQWIMPNAYGADINNTRLIETNVYGPIAKRAMQDVKSTGANYVVLACGFWYEWSLTSGPDFYGIDILNKKALLFDDGAQKINTSTLTQCGRAVAALLSLPITPEAGSPASIEDYKDNAFYVSSFLVSQRDMLDSVHRALGDSDADWSIESVGAEDRVENAVMEMRKGNKSGFIQAMYTQYFFKNGDGNFEKSREVAIRKLGLLEEDLDEVTKWAVDTLLEEGRPDQSV